MEVGDGSEGPSVVDKQLILSVNFKKCETIMRISLYVAREVMISGELLIKGTVVMVILNNEW